MIPAVTNPTPGLVCRRLFLRSISRSIFSSTWQICSPRSSSWWSRNRTSHVNGVLEPPTPQTLGEPLLEDYRLEMAAAHIVVERHKGLLDLLEGGREALRDLGEGLQHGEGARGAHVRELCAQGWAEEVQVPPELLLRPGDIPDQA